MLSGLGSLVQGQSDSGPQLLENNNKKKGCLQESNIKNWFRLYLHSYLNHLSLATLEGCRIGDLSWKAIYMRKKEDN